MRLLLLAPLGASFAIASCTHANRANPVTERVDVGSSSSAPGFAASLAEVTTKGVATEPAPLPPRCPAPPRVATITEPMRVDTFVAELGARIDALDTGPIDSELAPIAEHHALDPDSPRLVRDFRRLRTLFEATRDGGFWRLRWAITNQEPSSKLIWKQWAHSPNGELGALDGASATAECDEISALTSFLARRLDVAQVGLFYPTWNHTIVVWEPPADASKVKTKKPPRVLLPTTQIFLECDDAIDVTSFSETAQKNVYAYTPKDLSDDHLLSAETASFLLAQVDRYANASRDVLALIRLHRARRLSSSVGACTNVRAALATSIAAELTCADEDALTHYWTAELKKQPAEPVAIVRALGGVSVD